MDPFIEGQMWQDFHTTFITVAREALTQLLRPNYVVNVEEFVYVVRDATEDVMLVKPDVVVSESASHWLQRVESGSAVTIEPKVLTFPLPDRIEQHFLVIRRQKSQHVVTVIELLSPWNKTSEGRADYLAKRNNIVGTHSHLLELDLLRGGKRLPTIEPLPPADYYAFLTRTERVPSVEVFAWGIGQRLPTVPVPLADDDPDAALDLQAVVTTVYDRGGYDYALDYDLSAVTPKLNGEVASWASEVLASNQGDD
jgi:hypothetical protein